MKEKIGILGGTLNPIHLGHLLIAEEALEQMNLDKILFMPSGNPPHKNIADISSNEDRKAMIELAIEGNEKFEFSDFEMKRDGVIYTADTLELYLKENPNTELYFIMGADSLLYLDKWYMPEKILKYAKILVADRDFSSEEMGKYVDMLKNKYDICNIEFIKSAMICISSSDIRQKVKERKSIKYLVGSKVEKYILDKNLFM